jgi:phosphatidylglycerol---prolipoprotein diacylglyceryl transferase
MYPDLSYLFNDIFGTRVDNGMAIFKTFGFFLAIAFLLSAVTYYHELKRKAKQGFFTAIPEKTVEGAPASISEILSNALVGLILGGKGWLAYTDFEHFRPDPAAIILSKQMYWPAAIVGALALSALTWWDANRRRKNPPVETIVNVWPHMRISEITVWAAIGGILGAKIFDLFDNWESFLRDPVGSLASGGGLAFFGGLILGFIAVVWYQYTKKIPFLHAADAVAPALAVGYGVGRIGCQMSGDGDWGIVNSAPKPGWMSFMPDWLWSYRYPHTVLGELERVGQESTMIGDMRGVRVPNFEGQYPFQLEEAVFPTPIYEVMMMTVVFGVLWYLRKRISIPGMIFAIYLVLIGIERFIIEKIRVNVMHDVWGFKLTQAEIISLILIAIGLVFGTILWRKSKASTV